MSPSIRPDHILVVDDNADYVVILRRLITHLRGEATRVDWAPDQESGLQALRDNPPDVALIDHHLGNGNGLALIRRARETGCEVPMILLTGVRDRELDLAAMRAGAVDYLVKGNHDIEVLERSLRYAIERERSRKALQRTLEQAQTALRMREEAEAEGRAKDLFLAMVSHELRAPLTPILLGVEDLLQNAPLDDESRITLAMIQRNATLQSRMVGDLLDASRIAWGKLHLARETIDAHEILGQALNTCREIFDSRRIRIVLDLAAPLHHVSADPARLMQIFWNLLKNAAKFTPEGRSVTLRTRSEGDRLAIEVADQGVGIAAASLPKIFHAFEQSCEDPASRRGGLGLGLAIARSLAEAQDGTLEAESPGLGKGTTMRLELPLVNAPMIEEPVAPPSSQPRRARPLRILLVDDQPDTLSGLTLLLSRSHDVVAASGMHQALSLTRIHRFDLVVSDINLADGSGLDLMRELGSSGVQGIAMSGHGAPEDIEQSLKAGFAVHLTKPFTSATLIEAIRLSIARPPLAI